MDSDVQRSALEIRSRIALARIYLAAVRADGVVGDEEQARLRALLCELGITRGEFQSLLSDKSLLNLADLPPARQDRLNLLTNVLRLALADSDMAEAERSFVERLSQALELTGDEVDQCVRAARKQVAGDHPTRVPGDETKTDCVVLQEAIRLLSKDDYQGAARILDSRKKLRQYADDCREITMPWQQGAVVGNLQSLLRHLEGEGADSNAKAASNNNFYFSPYRRRLWIRAPIV